MFLAKPLRFRADPVCARSYAGRAPFFGAALFLCPADPARQVDSRIPASESTLRSCRRSVDIVACSPVPAPVSQISLAQALDVRLTRGFVPRLTSMLRSIRGGGPGRPARRVQAGLGEEREPACHLRPQHVCLHLAHSSMYGTTCPLPSVRLPAIATMRCLHAQDVAPLSHVHSTACTKRSSDSCGTRAMARQ